MSQKYVEKEFDAADFVKKSAAWYMSRAEYNPCSTKCGRELSSSREPKQVCVLKRIYCFALHDLWFSCFEGGFLCFKRYTRMSGIGYLQDYLSCSCYPACAIFREFSLRSWLFTRCSHDRMSVVKKVSWYHTFHAGILNWNIKLWKHAWWDHWNSWICVCSSS